MKTQMEMLPLNWGPNGFSPNFINLLCVAFLLVMAVLGARYLSRLISDAICASYRQRIAQRRSRAYRRVAPYETA